MEDILNEVKMQAQFRNRNIVNSLGLCVKEDFLLLLELCEIDVAKFIQNNPNVDNIKVLEILISVLNALEILHESGNVHRDIKPQNILIDENGTVKLGDFGLCSKVKQ